PAIQASSPRHHGHRIAPFRLALPQEGQGVRMGPPAAIPSNADGNHLLAATLEGSHHRLRRHQGTLMLARSTAEKHRYPTHQTTPLLRTALRRAFLSLYDPREARNPEVPRPMKAYGLGRAAWAFTGWTLCRRDAPPVPGAFRQRGPVGLSR